MNYADDALNAAYAEGRADQKQEDEHAFGPASRLIDAWIAIHNRPIPWAKAVEIVAVLNKMPDEERRRLLSLDGPEAA